jgi:hypothetical protein
MQELRHTDISVYTLSLYQYISVYISIYSVSISVYISIYQYILCLYIIFTTLRLALVCILSSLRTPSRNLIKASMYSSTRVLIRMNSRFSNFFTPARVVNRNQPKFNNCYPCHALRKLNRVVLGLEMRIGTEIGLSACRIELNTGRQGVSTVCALSSH